ncbi:MAG: hypothetical protein CMB31_05820 [Euryarchaeota archaeon]|nr:hypothetical protein [Euryarchaeota archaeon]
MVSMGVFHAISTEMVVGSFAVATIGTIICVIAALVPSFGERLPSRLHSHLDSAAYMASIFGVLMIPMAIITGYLTSESMGGQNSMTLNKMIFSGLCIGFWSGVISGRRLCGYRIWEHRGLSILQGLSASLGFIMTIFLGSIGGQLGRGETALDLLPFDLGIYTSPSIGITTSLILFIFSALSLGYVLFFQARPVIE